MDESYEIYFLRNSPYLLFHVDTCNTPNNVWTNLKDFLGNQDNLRGHQLKNDIHVLNSRDLKTLQTTFVSLKLLFLMLCLVELIRKMNR
jgi:hypothetical protein